MEESKGKEEIPPKEEEPTPEESVAKDVDEAVVNADNSIKAMNISKETDEATIRGFFAFCGEVVSIQVFPVEDETQTAIVEFKEGASALKAVHMGGSELDGRPINIIVLGRPKKQRKPGILAEVLAETEMARRDVIAGIQATKIPQTLEKIGAGISQTTKEVDEKLKISATFEDLGKKTSEQAKKIDEQLKITSTFSAMGLALSAWSKKTGEAMMKNEVVAKSVVVVNKAVEDTAKAVKGVANKMEQSVDEVKEERKLAILEREKREQAASKLKLEQEQKEGEGTEEKKEEEEKDDDGVQKCSGCGRKEDPSSELLACGACQQAFYCSRDCQVKDWSAHKVVCKELSKKKKVEDDGE